MKCISTLPALAAGLLLSLTAMAQEQGYTSDVPRMYRPVPATDQLFRKRVWRQIDLRERQNRPMFAQGHEISRVIMEAVKRGEILAYADESLTTTLSPREAVANMSFVYEGDLYSGSNEQSYWQETQDDSPRYSRGNSYGNFRGYWGRHSSAAGKLQPMLDNQGKPVKGRNGQVIMERITDLRPMGPPLEEYRYKDLYELELQEEIVFDTKRSRTTHEIKTISLHVPATLEDNVSGLEKPVATFRYTDVMKLFRLNPEAAIWFNTQNAAEHRNLADAFALRLFSSYITKVSNADDLRLDELAGSGGQGIAASYQQAAELVEREYNLWSF